MRRHRHLRAHAARRAPGPLVLIESTTYPGTTDEELLPILETSGLVCGRDFFLAFSPEREDPGRKDFDTKSTAKLVGGVAAPSTELAVVVSTAHELFQDAKLFEGLQLVVDTRNLVAGLFPGGGGPKRVVKA